MSIESEQSALTAEEQALLDADAAATAGEADQQGGGTRPPKQPKPPQRTVAPAPEAGQDDQGQEGEGDDESQGQEGKPAKMVPHSALHAEREERKKAQARADIDQALKLNPTNAEALEMRGDFKMETGDQAGAKADWQAVVVQSPRSGAAATARDRLNLLNQPAPAKPAAKP